MSTLTVPKFGRPVHGEPDSFLHGQRFVDEHGLFDHLLQGYPFEGKFGFLRKLEKIPHEPFNPSRRTVQYLDGFTPGPAQRFGLEYDEGHHDVVDEISHLVRDPCSMRRQEWPGFWRVHVPLRIRPPGR